MGLHIEIKKQPDPGQIQRASDSVSAPAKWIGRVAPSFELDLLDGSKFRLADHIGREVILLNFFATWCEPCRAEMPELTRYQEQNVKKPFLLVAIDAGEEAKLVQSFVEQFHLKSPVGIDRLRKLNRLFAVSAFPTNVLIGADGRVLLYEASAIANADVSLKPLVDPQLEMIRAGKGTSKEAYETAAASENYRGARGPERDSSIALQGRARAIAENIGCLCGCTNKLLDCTCQTATGMKK
jgi:thiol-disulfide isomerase/thioredoxin